MPKSKIAPPGRKGKIEADETTFATPSPNITNYITQIKSDVSYLQKLLFQWSIKTNSSVFQRSQRTILRDYLQHYHDYYEYDQFDSTFALLESLNVNLERITNQSLIYKSFDLFRKCVWPVRFNRKFIARINDYNYEEMLRVIGEVMLLANGHFPGVKNFNQKSFVKPIDTKGFPFNRFFTYKLFKEKNMIIHIGVEKVPVVSRNNIIKRYEFKNYIHFLEIIGDQFIENKHKLQERMNMFRQQILGDVAKKDHSEEIEVDNTKTQKFPHRAFFFYLSTNPYTDQTEVCQTQFRNLQGTNESDDVVYHPLPIKPFYVSSSETNSLVFDQTAKRWINQQLKDQMERKKIKQLQRKVNDQMIKRFVDFQSAKTLVELLIQIPNFKVNLTDQEKDVIGENGNVLAIGRSGTGKTTCAVLRLFSIEMLFKIRLSLFKKKNEAMIKDARCSSDDIDDTIGLHSIFLTASPVLTHQIQRYYRKLTDNIKQELQKKKKRVQAEKKLQQQKQEAEKKQEESVEIIQESFEDLNESVKTEQIQEKEEEIKENDNIIIPQNLAKTESNKSAECLEEEAHMTEQLKDLNLKEDMNNQNFEDEDFDELKNKFEDNIKNFHSLQDLTQKDYPGFFTVKSYIMMIDGTLQKPFFIRKKNVILEQESKAAWHNEKKGVMMIQNYYRNDEHENDINEDNLDAIQEEINYSDEEELEHEYMRQIQLKQNKGKQQLTKKLVSKKAKGLAFQVDYDYFLTHFWPNVRRNYYSNKNITAHLVWTQIYSTIKGSAFSHLYGGQYLTQSAYIEQTTNTFLAKDEKKQIYEAFCQYQRWKTNAGGYDIMDTVNYILNYIRFRGYEGPQIHYIMIDEVQDLPHAMVYLLSKTATYGVFYSGDTAQTIAKGVGFRFCDLKSLFNHDMFDGQFKLKAPIIKHLTINFRSHNNILQLANSVVSSIQILFPKTIDRMKKEVSDLAGPKPMILSDDGGEQLLFYVLCGQEGVKQVDTSFKKPPLEFGCDQVIIVRDQQSKAKIPPMLQHALCLTIYEAKGLQFNDVILFNFFAETKCPEKWNLLKYLNIVDIQMKKEEYEASITKHKQEAQKQKEKEKQKDPNEIKQPIEQKIQEIDVEFNVKQDKQIIKIKKIVSDASKIMKDINDYAQLCSELKLLYTAITRPRKTLIIYDQESAARKSIQRIWERLEIIEVVTNEMVLQNNKKTSECTQEMKVFKRIINTTDHAQWKKQGMRMYSRGYFEQAMKCFERSGNKELFQKAEANKYADQATKKLILIEAERNALKEGNRNISSAEQGKLKKQLKTDQTKAYKEFLIAAQIFQNLLMFKQAGQCYFSGKKFDKAYECFCKAFMNKQAAQSLEMQNKYRLAAEYYEKDDDYLKVIECLDMVNEWTLILNKIQKYSLKMSEIEKQSLLKKYAALALEQLVYQIEFQNETQENKPQNNRVEVIQEKDSEQEEEIDEDEQDPELAADREYERKLSQELSSNQPSRKQSELSEDIKNSQKKDEVVMESIYEKEQLPILVQKESLDSFQDLNTSEQPITQKKQEQQPKQISESSFVDLIQGSKLVPPEQKGADLESIQSSFSDINAKYENQLQPDLQSIKSLVDPDDLWVKNSISQIEHKVQSQFSVIDGDQQNYNTNAKIIKTKGNIFIQDEIMQKIIAIVSIINSSVHQFFKQFKGYQSLITVSKDKEQNQNQIDNRPEISQFEDIDPQFINIILDTLESFKLYKLCLFVCNRYHMPNKAGRYLTSIAMKYSTNCQSINNVNPVLLAPSPYRKNQLEKGILASIAVHAIFQNVNADFLKIKIQDNEEKSKNSLGSYFIQGLILQGMYKKTIFMVNPKESLHILYNYNDYSTFNSLFKQKILKNDEQTSSKLSFLIQPPKTATQADFSIILLKKVLFDYHVAHRMEGISNRYYKQFHEDPLHPASNIVIPDYLPFTKNLIENRQTMSIFLCKNIHQGYNILRKGKNYEIFDFVSAIVSILHSDELQTQVCQLLDIDGFLELYRCINYIKMVCHKLHTNQSAQIIDPILNLYQVIRIKSCKSLSFLGDNMSFVHRTSVIANQFVQNKANAHFAFFIEQDYNLILVKTVKVLKLISKRLDSAVNKFYHKRSNIHTQNNSMLPQDFIRKEQEEVLIRALKAQTEMSHPSETKKLVAKSQKPASKTLAASFDFKMKGKEEYAIQINESSESQEQTQFHQQIKTNYTLPSFNPKMQYLIEPMLYLFANRSKYSKEIANGKELYCSNLNNYYRQYVEKQGGYNLFDAIEFKKFKRIDLYAQNIYSVIDNFSLGDKHIFTSELLILLMIEHKRLVSGNKFKIELTKDTLKFLPGLKFSSAVGNNQKQKIQSNDVRVLLKQNFFQCIFEYRNEYTGQLSADEIAEFICDYLSIIQQQEASQFINFSSVLLALVINIDPDQKLYDELRKVINILRTQWKDKSLSHLIQAKNYNEFCEKRQILITRQIVKNGEELLHQIRIQCVGNLQKSIQDSEFDYIVQGKIILGKRKAASKIVKWWRKIRIEPQERARLNVKNYFQHFVKSKDQRLAPTLEQLQDLRLIETIHHDQNVMSDPLFVLRNEASREQLLSFYLTTVISSSLDFHFILMTLNRIQESKNKYLQICKDYQQGFIEEEQKLEDLNENAKQIEQTVIIWKNDAKWLKEKNLNLKRKKVFEVKWMTKNLHFNKIIKKRAGLKQQEKLQQKRKMIKRIQGR